jgi:DNA-binding MarR family transcriptional regulator
MRQDARQQDNFAAADPPHGRGQAGERDAVDAIVAAWERERPDLDPSAKHVTGRIVRLASIFQDAFAAAFAPLGITDGDYGVLATLRRAGAPYRLTPTDLARHRMMTSGGMTAAIDRLERRSLVARQPNPDDRRGSLVELTAEGLATVDAAMAVHAATEQALVAALGPSDRVQLEQLLRTVLLAVDGQAAATSAHTTATTAAASSRPSAST